MAEAFRTCPTTGLKVHLPAENLIKANAVAAVVFLAVGGLFGLLVALNPCAMVRGGHHAELSPLRLRRAGAGGDAPPAARVPARPDARRPVARLVHRRPAPVAVLFAAGVSGYWVVWDELAQYVAVATTEWLDTLPLFGEPIARNFLHPSTLGSRFFILLVFIHIFVSLAMLFVISPRCASR